jgi:hypothetical protein
MKNEERMNGEVDIEARLTLALDTVPVIDIPTGFTACVMAGLPSKLQPLPLPLLLHRTHYGRRAMQVCTLVLCILLAASVLVTRGQSQVWLVAQCIVFAQLACLLIGFTLRQWRS